LFLGSRGTTHPEGCGFLIPQIKYLSTHTMEESDKKIKLIAKLILERLIGLDKWGGAHSELKKVLKSLPNYIRDSNKGKKHINKATKLLVNYNLLYIKPSTGELHVSLNPRMKKEIYEFIDEIDNDKLY
jgi:hypothetical protein|tara:strand:+ start:809 stop:1195 length:387 start_codon:yes stop_codon:yes gene_type:complete